MKNKKTNKNYWLLGLLLGVVWCIMLVAQTRLVRKAYSNQKDVFNLKLDEALSQTLSPIDTIYPEQLDSVISGGLARFGIDDPYELGLYSPEESCFIYATAGTDTVRVVKEGFKFNIVCGTPSGQLDMRLLYLGFPSIEHKIHWNTVMSYFGVIVLTLLVLFCFVRFFLGIRRQHRINEFRENMVHNMVHELKTPLTTIDLASQFLQDESVVKDEAMTQSYLKMISDESKSVRGLVDQILTVFSSEKLLEHNETDVYVNRLLTTVANIHHLALVECKGELHFDLQAERDVVYGDITQLSNAFSNLIDNAIKYRNGNLVLNISTQNVGNTIRISFADNGMGIEASNLPLIFEPFTRFNTENEHYVKGFGLGLNYVDHVVKNHKGTISVESELHHGTTFVITLPLKTV